MVATTSAVTRDFDAPRRLVFLAWTDPARAASWWTPRGFTTLSCTMDVRPGGGYRIGMRSPAGTEHWKQGVYHDIVTPERLVFSFAWEDASGRPGRATLVTVTFAERGTQTRLTLHQAGSGRWDQPPKAFVAWSGRAQGSSAKRASASGLSRVAST